MLTHLETEIKKLLGDVANEATFPAFSTIDRNYNAHAKEMEALRAKTKAVQQKNSKLGALLAQAINNEVLHKNEHDAELQKKTSVQGQKKCAREKLISVNASITEVHKKLKDSNDRLSTAKNDLARQRQEFVKNVDLLNITLQMKAHQVQHNQHRQLNSEADDNCHSPGSTMDVVKGTDCHGSDDSRSDSGVGKFDDTVEASVRTSERERSENGEWKEDRDGHVEDCSVEDGDDAVLEKEEVAETRVCGDDQQQLQQQQKQPSCQNIVEGVNGDEDVGSSDDVETRRMNVVGESETKSGAEATNKEKRREESKPGDKAEKDGRDDALKRLPLLPQDLCQLRARVYNNVKRATMWMFSDVISKSEAFRVHCSKTQNDTCRQCKEGIFEYFYEEAVKKGEDEKVTVIEAFQYTLGMVRNHP